MILGMGESVAYPAYSKILAGNLPEYHRGLANALIDAGSKCGPGLGTLLGGMLMARFGWRPFFIVLGCVSMLWLPPWFRWMPRGESLAAKSASEAPGIGEILSHGAAWATFGGLFCANYFWYFLLTWLPSYLVDERHFSMDTMATVGASAYFVMASATTISGWISDRWIAHGASPTRVRKTFTGIGLTFSTVILGVAVAANQNKAMALLMAACISFGVFTSNHWAITQTLAGPLAAGKWTGLQNCVGNMAGVVAPWLTGWVVNGTGQFYWAFVVAAGVVLTGAVIYGIVIRKVAPVTWRNSAA
jgi:ACS family D-galactonate transporter-like MFS transporter